MQPKRLRWVTLGCARHREVTRVVRLEAQVEVSVLKSKSSVGAGACVRDNGFPLQCHSLCSALLCSLQREFTQYPGSPLGLLYVILSQLHGALESQGRRV